MDRIKNVIDNQINLNAGKNLFYKDTNLFSHSDELISIIDLIHKADDFTLNILTDYAVKKCMEEFCRVNQYYNFNSDSQQELKRIYTELVSNIKNKSESLETSIHFHKMKLEKWIAETNPFSLKIYRKQNKILKPVPCSEYTPELQLELLNIQLDKIISPVLDIGCGKKAGLVNYLRDKGIDVYGIDRFVTKSPFTDNSDWLEYDYGINKWGTIISNLSFSNHFMHHHLRTDGQYIEYAKKYMQILASLKIGGAFHYAPALPFIEQYPDKMVYQITTNEINGEIYKSTLIKRVR